MQFLDKPCTDLQTVLHSCPQTQHISPSLCFLKQNVSLLRCFHLKLEDKLNLLWTSTVL